MKRLIINSQKSLSIISRNGEEVFTKAKYGPSKLTRIPLVLCENLSFLAGAIIGDGHLKLNKFQISLELTDRKLIEDLKKKFYQIFKREFNIKKVKLRLGRKQTFSMVVDSKAIYKLFEEVFEIPPGRKSHIVKVPKLIFKSNKVMKLSFLKGIIATEGGKRRRGFGLSTASKQLWEDLEILFGVVGIPVSKDRWIYKKYKKEYYGITFKGEYMPILMRECRSGQTE